MFNLKWLPDLLTESGKLFGASLRRRFSPGFKLNANLVYFPYGNGCEAEALILILRTYVVSRIKIKPRLVVVGLKGASPSQPEQVTLLGNFSTQPQPHQLT